MNTLPANQAVTTVAAIQLPNVVLFDLWYTLTFSLEKDPILSLQEVLGIPGPDDDPAGLNRDFLRVCLTTNIADRQAFLKEVASKFGVTPDENMLKGFEAILAAETGNFGKFADTEKVLAQLKANGHRVGLISNLWPFPVQHIFEVNGLGALFEHKIYSFEVGSAKPDRAIYEAALTAFGVTAEQCAMIGDSVENDVRGALNVGIRAILIDRKGTAKALPESAQVISSLSDLLTAPTK